MSLTTSIKICSKVTKKAREQVIRLELGEEIWKR